MQDILGRKREALYENGYARKAEKLSLSIIRCYRNPEGPRGKRGESEKPGLPI
jgi:hypothetical protein